MGCNVTCGGAHRLQYNTIQVGGLKPLPALACRPTSWPMGDRTLFATFVIVPYSIHFYAIQRAVRPSPRVEAICMYYTGTASYESFSSLGGLPPKKSLPIFPFPLAGYVGGLQCDVWRASALPRPGTPPWQKLRLPAATAAFNAINAATTMNFNFTLEVKWEQLGGALTW